MENAIQPPDRMRAPADEVDWTGQVLGEFRLLHRLGRGGMGQVYLAEQTSLKRKVALKLLHPELASNERSLLRFKAEAENVARATHANIVQIYTIGQANGVNYLALEYVEGKNLREYLEKKGTPELALGLHIMAQVAAALQRASELGIIHRDIKPENILLTKKGEVKVADFGLSRCFAEEAQQSITQSQVSMGTPLYMSPEQVERKTVDTRTDIYSFGVTCYHMFAGTPPFRGTSPFDVAYQHVHKDPQLLSEIRPDLPAELCAIVQKMMAKNPEDRYQTAREIARDINRLGEALNLGAVAAISISSSFIAAPTEVGRASPTQQWVEPARRAPGAWQAAIVGSVLLALAGGLALGWYQNRREADPQGGRQLKLPDNGEKDKKPLKEREQELKRRVEDVTRDGQLEIIFGLKAYTDLGLFYLKHRRLDEADAIFQDIRKPERKVPAYSFLGRLGHAMVLAFRDDAAASNKEFTDFFTRIEKLESRPGIGKIDRPKEKLAPVKDEFEAYRLLWKENHASIREMVAQALNRNQANDPKGFPEKLEAYRFPPRPTLKGPPAP